MVTHPMPKIPRGPDPVKYRQQIEKNVYMHVRHPTTIERIAVITLDPHIPQVDKLYEVDARELKSLRRTFGNWTRFRLSRRLWRTVTPDVPSRSRVWDSLAMAQAQRDGLNYHYARWLMVKDTEAQHG